MQIGERTWNLKRCINIRQGLSAANDKLPKALLEPFNEGGSADYVPPFSDMMAAYYLARDWNPKTGIPTKKKLLLLGLKEQANEFYP